MGKNSAVIRLWWPNTPSALEQSSAISSDQSRRGKARRLHRMGGEVELRLEHAHIAAAHIRICRIIWKNSAKTHRSGR